MTAGIRVLLADDDHHYRATLRTLVDSTPALSVVAEAVDGQDAVDRTIAHSPDVVLMDVRMPRMDGLTAVERLGGQGNGARIIVLTTFDLDEYVYRVLRAGASGFLLKDTSPARLLDGITAAAAGDALLAPTVTRRLIDEFTGAGPGRPGRLDGVTPRECEVLALITRGLSNHESEHHLHLSRGTVKTHIGRLMAKLHARDRAQLVIAGYESGLADTRR
ncbi:MAG: response regulator transcription factor [Pseudonocardia sp.]|nr:response regulator transcription factor [Pseudonocardia sp.]